MRWLVHTVRGGLLGVVVALALLAPAAPSFAAADVSPPFITGAVALGATVTGPGLAKPATITANAAGTFMQSWVAASVYGKPILQSPAKNAAVYHLTVRQEFRAQKSDVKVLYAISGSNAWVTMPAPQDLGWALVTTPHWIKAQPITITAFHDAVKNLPIASSAPAAPGTKTSSSSHRSLAWLWIVVVIAAIVVGVGLGIEVRNRRRTRERIRAKRQAG